MRKIFVVSLLIIFTACSQCSAEKQRLTEETKATGARTIEKGQVDTIKKSIPAIATGNINGTNIIIRYHSPAVRGRIIWGGLVPYDQVWVTGAHMATSIESARDLRLGGKKIPAGKYAFFTIPGKEEWTIIINKNWQQHLTDEYNAADDLVRLRLKPVEAEHQERLRYEVDQTGENHAVIEMSWEKLCLKVPFRLDL